MKPGVVVVGAGQAGFQVAASLRAGGYGEPITLVGDEPHIPYQRPPLSKAFVAGKQEVHHLNLRAASYYDSNAIELLGGQTVTRIDLANRRVQLMAGRVIPYRTLVLAAGARVRKLQIPGAELDGVHYLRTVGDSSAIRARLLEPGAVRHVVVIGGGFIGLELAAVARALGKSVAVVEMQSRLMPRVVSAVISEFFRELHAGQGVKIVLGAGVAEIGGDRGRAREVVLTGGARHPADLVIAGIGVVPNVELARDAGLAVGDGIFVDENLRTEDENIYAIGDCSAHPNLFAGGRVRIESVQNAVDQASAVAGAISGRPGPYRNVPWFWTDQFDIKLQMVGLSPGYDRAVTRGDPESRKFSVFYFREGRLIAIDSINRPGDHLAGRRLLTLGSPLTPDQAADESIDLKKFGA